MFGQTKGYPTACRCGQGEIEYINHPSAVKINCKSFCEVAYAYFGQTFFATVRGYQWRFGYGRGCMHDDQQVNICSIFKKRKCARKYLATIPCNIIYIVPCNLSYF